MPRVDVALAPRRGLSPRMAAEAMACGVPPWPVAGPDAVAPYAAFLRALGLGAALVACGRCANMRTLPSRSARSPAKRARIADADDCRMRRRPRPLGRGDRVARAAMLRPGMCGMSEADDRGARRERSWSSAFPTLAARLERRRRVPVGGRDGEWRGAVDIRIDERSLYGGDAGTFAPEQVAAYLEKPLRLFMNSPDAAGLVSPICIRLVKALDDHLNAEGRRDIALYPVGSPSFPRRLRPRARPSPRGAGAPHRGALAHRRRADRRIPRPFLPSVGLACACRRLRAPRRRCPHRHRARSRRHGGGDHPLHGGERHRLCRRQLGLHALSAMGRSPRRASACTRRSNSPSSIAASSRTSCG